MGWVLLHFGGTRNSFVNIRQDRRGREREREKEGGREREKNTLGKKIIFQLKSE